MAKVLYCLKMFMFGAQMQYSKLMLEKQQRMSQFIVLFFAGPWLACTSAANAFTNDRSLYCKLKQYGQLDEGAAEAALLVLNWHLWYMSSELAPLALFSDLFSGSEKQEAADKLLQCNPNLTKGKPEFPQLRPQMI